MDTAAYIESLRGRDSLPKAFAEIAKGLPDKAIYSQAHIQADGSRIWREETYREVAAKIYRLANYLAKIGVGPNTKVAIISYTRPEWMIAHYAILFAGATSVSVYQSISAHEMGYVLFDSGASLAFAENEEQYQKLKSLISSPYPIPATEDRPATTHTLKLDRIITFEEVATDPLVTPLDQILKNAEIPETMPNLSGASETASLVYTSGTTGPPKGVIQTHKNHLANVWQAAQTKIFAPEGDIFLFLPLAHSFAKLIGHIGFITPTVAKFPAVTDRKSSVLNAQSVLRDLRECSAEVAPIVPRILEKMMSGVIERSKGKNLQAKLVAFSIATNLEVFKTRQAKQTPSPWLLLKSALAKPIAKITKEKLFGPKFKHIVSGGARLPIEVNEFFSALNITIYEGYGLTETCVATNVNPLGKPKIGSVGPCMKDLEIKIASDGEILFRGPNVTKGYLNRPTATKEQWDSDGWFHTGDLGALDADGYLFITGRKKDIIVTAGGKKVAPQAIEEKFNAATLISTAVMVGEGKPYCSILIVPDKDTVREWAKGNGVALPNNLSECSELKTEYGNLVEEVNKTLSKFETIKKFKILDADLSVENGMLTPTFKVKRGVVTKKFAEVIEDLYSSPGE